VVGPVIAVPAAQADPAGATVVDEGTNIAAAVSPDGRWVALDLVTAIWVVPAAGGSARRLTGDDTDASQPHWSPDSTRIAFQAYRDGNYHLWVVNPDGTGARQLTSGPYDHREPKFSPDGRHLAFASDRGGSYGIYTYDLASGAIATVTDTAAEQATPAWSPDGRRLAYTVDDQAIDVVELAGGTVTRAVAAPAGARLYGPAFAPDGATLSYVRVLGASADLMAGDRQLTRGEDVFAFPAIWISADTLVYTADGRIRRRSLGGEVATIGFAATVPVTGRRRYRRAVRDLTDTRVRQARGIAGPVASRDGTRVAFRALGALWLLKVGDPRPTRLVADGYFNSDPDFSPDGRSIVYASDRAGSADLWRRDLTTGAEERLTALPGAQITPRWSPDGTRIAYVDHDGATWVLDLASGTVRQVTPTLFMPGRPSWSADGGTLALAAVKPYSRRYREGTSQILTVDLRTGALTYTEPLPHASLSTRGDDGPVWSPDGRRLAFVVESVAWVLDADLANPRQVTHEYTDSLAWRGAGRLLYLHAGRLREVDIDAGRTTTIPVNLPWRRARTRDRVVVRAGALWDGRADRLRQDVDILLDGDRIAEVGPRRGRTGSHVVDASDLTVMPGLIDAHVHWHLRGRQWGDRQGRTWLAYGITTTRSPGDPVYQMVETREALESGAQVGPRYFATGEAIDGSRVYYNFMRTTRSTRQLALELQRAVDLGYDLVKTYVRLPVAAQRLVIKHAHRAGLPLSSHYLYPAERLGMDGMEHFGATNRLGYSHTSSRLGRSYADAIRLFAASGMSITPTLFTSSAMYADDRSLVEDPRTRALYPQWEYERFVQKADDARTPAGEVTRALLTGHVEMMLRIHRAGGFVIAGTDAPLDNPAVSLHTNLRAMVRYGFTPYEALTTATANPARWLGLPDRLGVVAPGAFADLSFVMGDPLADIRAAADVRMVMVGGVLRTVEDLLAPFVSAPAAAAVSHQVVPRVPAPDEPWWHEPEWSRHVCCGE
jgi:Tol biopolymer transport system component/cytosine/adenosine deaminase-related metal-dependent hydrolase